MTAQARPHQSFTSGDQPVVLATIYDEQMNIAIWQRALDSTLRRAAEDILKESVNLQIACTVKLDNCTDTLFNALGKTESARVLADDIYYLVDMYCCLFELDRVALRIAKLEHAMCPKFHVDRVPVRLVTTYLGPGTEWLPNRIVDRSKLGIASVGVPDDKSGVYQIATDIQQTTTGDVVLLKGENWIGNEGNGIVHRSPQLPSSTQRLVMTLDFAADE